MKKLGFLFCILLLGFFSISGAQTHLESRVDVYYFYTNYRCPTCTKMEKYTKEAVEKYFSNELAAGTVQFRALNTDKDENQHFMKDYQLYTKSVVISMVKKNQEVKYKNLSKIWEYVNDKQKFYEYIKTQTNEYLEELK